MKIEQHFNTIMTKKYSLNSDRKCFEKIHIFHSGNQTIFLINFFVPDFGHWSGIYVTVNNKQTSPFNVYNFIENNRNGIVQLKCEDCIVLSSEIPTVEEEHQQKNRKKWRAISVVSFIRFCKYMLRVTS